MPLQLPTEAWDPSYCSTMCQSDPNCAMYVYLPPTCATGFSDAAVCYLKASVPPSVAKDCRCSGFVNRTINPTPGQPDTVLYILSTSTVSVGLGKRGLIWLNSNLSSPTTTLSLTIELDTWVLGLNNNLVLNSSDPWAQSPSISQISGSLVQYIYTYSDTTTNSIYTITVSYELQETWNFVRKNLEIISNTPSIPIVIMTVAPFDTLRMVTTSTLSSTVYPSGDMGTYGAFLRYFNDPQISTGSGVLVTAQNPFLYPSVLPVPPLYSSNVNNSVLVRIIYHPSIIWNFTTVRQPQPTPFIADSGILSVYNLGQYQLPPYADPIRDTLVHLNPLLYNDTVMYKEYSSNKHYRRLTPYAITFATSNPTFFGKHSIVSHAIDTGNGMLTEHVQYHPDQSLSSISSPRLSSIHDTIADPSWLYVGERDSFRYTADSLMEYPTSNPIQVHIPWTENDYQINICNATEFDEYVRILVMLNRLGIQHILYAASDSDVSAISNNTDTWGWEEVCWINLAQDIRQQYWIPGVSPLPESTQQLVDLATSLNVHLMPYVYPILGFTADPSWLYPTGHPGWYHARLADRNFQDYLIDTTIAFANTIGSGGAGYDYTFFEDSNATQQAQWIGWRRIMSTVRANISTTTNTSITPYVVDNRQLNHMWSPWMWTAGSYAEPLQTDEGPYSWNAFIQNPHTDHQSANQQRLMNYDYAQSKLCQPSAMPGFMQHQSDRFENGGIPYTDLNVRDYDFYGASYAVISALATGGLNAVVCGLPARDEGEFTAFPQSTPQSNISISVDFYRYWFNWATENANVLRLTKYLPVIPSRGAIDGTYAINSKTNTGYLFLFNPNPQVMTTPSNLLGMDSRLDIQCSNNEIFIINEIWPITSNGLTTVQCGSNFTITMEGRSAMILSIAPQSLATKSDQIIPIGRAVRDNTNLNFLNDNTLVIENWADLAPLSNSNVEALYRSCNGISLAPLYAYVPNNLRHSLSHVVAKRSATDVQSIEFSWIETDNFNFSPDSPVHQYNLPATVSSCIPRTILPPPSASLPNYSLLAIHLPVPQAAPTFVHSAPIQGMGYNASYTGGNNLTGTINIPQSVFDQLANRNQSYPVPWTTDDQPIAWLIPGRLIAYLDVNFAIKSTVTLQGWIGNSLTPIPINPVFSCRSLRSEQCFSGFWIDLTASPVPIVPNTDIPLVISLPTIEPAGTFGGVYYDNIDSIYSN